MNKKTLIAVTFCLALSLPRPIRVNAGGAPPALASADWSVNAAHNLASNPPSLDAVQDFYDRAYGISDEFAPRVCEFRFADLRNSGNLSLIMTVNPQGRQLPECNEFFIFDRTPKGFELYETDRAFGQDLVNSVLDINHDGRQELVLWSELNRNGLGCDAQWPLIFAWSGNGYSEVSHRYKDYYRNYLKSVDARLAAYSSELESASAQAANPATTVGRARVVAEAFSASGAEASEGSALQWSLPKIAAPTPTPKANLNLTRRDYPCARIQAAKTEAFLGIDSDSTMSAAVKDSESTDPHKRILAAATFSYFGSPEAKADLKTLSNDADSRVAAIAKGAASRGEDPAEYYRRMIPGGASFGW
jgi:hypothetical protein